MTICEYGKEPAYPTSLTGKWAGTGAGATFAPDMTDGLTKREIFAMAAMSNLCRDCSPDYSKGQCNNAIVERAVILADALLAELNKSKL